MKYIFCLLFFALTAACAEDWKLVWADDFDKPGFGGQKAEVPFGSRHVWQSSRCLLTWTQFGTLHA